MKTVFEGSRVNRLTSHTAKDALELTETKLEEHIRQRYGNSPVCLAVDDSKRMGTMRLLSSQ